MAATAAAAVGSARVSEEAAAFTIEPMRPEEYEECLEIACAAFMSNNPLFISLEVTLEAFRAFARADIPREAAVDTGLSLVAKGPQGTLKGFLFLRAMDITKLPPKEIFEQHSGLVVIKEIAEHVYQRALCAPCSGLRLGSMVRGKVLHAAMGGTLPSADGQGLGKALRLRAVEVARERGFNTLVVEPGHGATRHIWTKYCGGVIRAEEPLETFKSPSGVRGEFPAKGVEGTLSICEVVIRNSKWDTPVCWPFFLGSIVVHFLRWQR